MSVITGNKVINLAQLQAEMQTARTITNEDLVQSGDFLLVVTPTDQIFAGIPVGQYREFIDEVSAQAIVDAHIAMRPKTDNEYSVEFQTANSSRQEQIKEILLGLRVRERVPA